jgi:hypothetical protein
MTKVNKYAIGFVLAVLAFSVFSHWRTSREFSQVCDALLRSTHLTPMQNYDPTIQPFGYAVKECSSRLEKPFGDFDAGLFGS